MVGWYWGRVVLWWYVLGVRLDVCCVYLGLGFLVGVGFSDVLFVVLFVVGGGGVVS